MHIFIFHFHFGVFFSPSTSQAFFYLCWKSNHAAAVCAQSFFLPQKQGETLLSRHVCLFRAKTTKTKTEKERRIAWLWRKKAKTWSKKLSQSNENEYLLETRGTSHAMNNTQMKWMLIDTSLAFRNAMTKGKEDGRRLPNHQVKHEPGGKRYQKRESAGLFVGERKWGKIMPVTSVTSFSCSLSDENRWNAD